MSEETMSRALERAVSLIQKSESFYVGTHIRPDGDALGSLLALSLALECQQKRVARLCADPAPASYGFLAGADRISPDPPDWTADMGIVVDCDGIGRLGPLEAVFERLPRLLDVDHHATGQTFGEVRLVDPSAGAAAEIVYELVRSLGVEIGPDIATCLYAGILTDTGRFTYGNATSASLRIASELVEAGADPHGIARNIYEDRSVAATHLLGIALARLSANDDAGVVSAMLTRRDFVETGAAASETEGIIDHLRAIGGRRVALLFVETDGDRVRVSLRSDGSVDVSAVALQFGGGGHAMAAGCTVQGRGEEVRDKLLAAVRGALRAANAGHDS